MTATTEPSRKAAGYTLADHHVSYGVMVPTGELRVDPSVQRTLDVSRCKRMADSFTPTAVGTIVVSERANGEKFIVDGMHRHKTCELEGSMSELACEIHYGLDLEDEAQLFLIKNRESKGVGAYDQYKVGVTAGLGEYVATRDVLAKRGLVISNGGSSANRVGAAGGYPKIVLTLGAEHLDRALGILEGALGRTQYTWEGNLVYGTTRVLREYGTKISDPELMRKLRAAKMTAEDLVIEINSRARSGVGSSGSGSRRMAGFYVVLDKVNARRSKKSLFGPPAYLEAKLGYSDENLATDED